MPTSTPIPTATPTRTATPTTTPTPTPKPTPLADPDRPADALSLGDAVELDGIRISVTKFIRIRPKEALDDFAYYSALVSYKNMTNGPKVIFPAAQMRLENPYIATINPLPSVEAREGSWPAWGAFRPGETVDGWVVWGIHKESARSFLKSFGVYYVNDLGDEAVWWLNVK
ncbi:MULTISPECIES: hypothetical protein [unclassified Knoellia]|uniref:hypothetical protein n=1 Tax=Knoellia altitudinis TaxID=3404795 RepID=UPI003622CC99